MFPEKSTQSEVGFSRSDFAGTAGCEVLAGTCRWEGHSRESMLRELEGFLGVEGCRCLCFGVSGYGVGTKVRGSGSNGFSKASGTNLSATPQSLNPKP